MQYAFQRAEGFVMITGRPGTGKTTLVNDLIHSLDKRKTLVGMLVLTQLEDADLLRMVADAFGLPSETEQKSLLLQRLTKLFSNAYVTGKRALLIIDEAQDLSTTALEELRLLTNLQMNNQPLLQIFLLGQEELREMIHKRSMEQVHQRMVATCHLQSLSEEDTKAYILHRLKEAGWSGDPAISEAVYPVIHKFSLGIPRRINMICSRLFLHGCVEELHQIGIKDAKEVLLEIKNEQLTAENIPSDSDFEVADRFEKAPEPLKAVPSEKKKPLTPAVNIHPERVKEAPEGSETATNPPVTPIKQAIQINKEEKKESKKEATTKKENSVAQSAVIKKSEQPVDGNADKAPSERASSEKEAKHVPEQTPAETNDRNQPDLRRRQRRNGKDRRKEMRFGLHASERRQEPGRRKADQPRKSFTRRLWRSLTR